jgi:pyruvate,water dikinase
MAEPSAITNGSPPDKLRRLAGAKGHKLYELDRHGVAVPPWAIVGTDVFASFLDECGITDELNALLATVTATDAEDVAAKAAALIIAGELGPTARRVVETAYRHVGAEWVAVRSSGAEEDGAEYSFAGQFDTFLNVHGLAEVLAKVKECWASAFSARSLHYRRSNNLPLDSGQMAVIVQRMVVPRRSGVLFTANPSTGDRTEYVVSSVYGLGEGLVSGAVDADTVAIDAASGEVRGTVIGEKERRYDAAANSGCEVSDVPAAQRAVLSVTASDLVQLREAGARLTEIFGSPQDIEWSVADDRLWVLQSRPITTHLNPPAAPAEPMGELRIWDNSNIIESFSGITSPLTFSFAANAYGRTYAYYARSLRVPAKQRRQMEDWLPNLLGYFHGHVYYNLMHWYRMLRITPGYPVTRKVLEAVMGVEESLPDELAESVYPYSFSSAARRRVSRTVTAATFGYRFLAMNRAVARFRRYFYDAYRVFDNVDYDALRGDEVYRRYCDLERDLLERWGPMMLLDVTILISVGALHLLTKRWLPDAPEWFGWAVSTVGEDVESAEPARALSSLAETVRGNATLHRIVTETEPGEVRRVLTEEGLDSFLSAVDDYVDKYGYRSPDELKLEVPDLSEDPSSLFLMLRDALAEPTAAAGGGSAQEYLDAHLRGPRRWAYEIVRRKTSASLANRERLRFCRTRAFGSAKRMMRSMGRDLARLGAIAEFDDVFMLRLDELRGVFEGAIAHEELRELVAVRRRQRARDKELVAPSRFTTRGVPYWNGNLEAAGWSTAGAARSGVRELRGTPSSPGTAEGNAVVATEPRDVNGGVLIAYRTDPGWVAALPAVSGLVIERGSPLTHVAVVARELGIPTVVQVRGATREIQTGMRVRVDGGAGLVTVLDATVLDATVLDATVLDATVLDATVLDEVTG